MPRNRSARFSLVALVSWITASVAVVAAVGAAHAWQAGRDATERELTSLLLTDISGQTHVDTFLPYGAPLPRPGKLGVLSAVFATGQAQVSDLQIGPLSRDYVVAVDVPVELDGQVAYGLTMAFTPSRLTAAIDARQDASEEWRALIVDGNGLLVAGSSNVATFVGHRVSSASHAAIGHGEGVFKTTSQDGYPMLAAHGPVPRTGWSTVAATRLDRTEAGLLRSLTGTAAASAALLSLGVFTAGWYARRVARPLHARVDTADTLAQGEQPQPVPPGVRKASRPSAAVTRTAATLRLREQERARNDAALHTDEAHFRAVTDAMPQMVWSAQADGRHDYYNLRWHEYTGIQMGGLHGEGWRRLFKPHDLARAAAAWRRSLATGESYEAEYRLRRADGTWRWCLSRAAPMHDADTGAILRWLGTCTDIQELVEARETLVRSRAELEHLVAERTQALLQAADALHAETAKRAEAEDALHQTHKMEAVGQLAGSIAHDFNNMLQGISSSLELVQRRTEQGRIAEAEHFIGNALKTVDRAAALTSRLLAFTRRQPLQPKLVNPDELVLGMEELIRRTVRPSIRIELQLGSAAGTVFCDPNQLENALLNLAINSGDAMPNGGRLTISVCHVELAEADIAGSENASPGDYLEIAIADTGTGMDDATLARAFEPFFTTKPVGKGTGLGLSQLLGFMRQLGGVVRVDSELGRGTTMRLYLPRHEPMPAVGKQQMPMLFMPALQM